MWRMAHKSMLTGQKKELVCRTPLHFVDFILFLSSAESVSWRKVETKMLEFIKVRFQE